MHLLRFYLIGVISYLQRSISGEKLGSQANVEVFKTIGSAETAITVYFEEKPIPARIGETVAACLLRSGVPFFRTTPISGAPRLPYCMIGHCFECLIEIDGAGNRQACLLAVEDGMRLRTQNGSASIPGIEA